MARYGLAEPSPTRISTRVARPRSAGTRMNDVRLSQPQLTRVGAPAPRGAGGERRPVAPAPVAPRGREGGGQEGAVGVPRRVQNPQGRGAVGQAPRHELAHLVGDAVAVVAVGERVVVVAVGG